MEKHQDDIEDYDEEGSTLLSIQEQVDKLIVRVLQLEARIQRHEQTMDKQEWIFCNLL
jgi:hypothetical protein